MTINSYFNLCVIFFFSIVSFIAGCSDRADKLIACENQTQKLREQNEKLTQQLVDCQHQLIMQKTQIENLQKFGRNRLEDMIRLERITLEKLTGGYDSNHDGYDDGIVVYLQPIDTDGHIVKVAGSVKVKLFSLDSKPRLIGRIELTPSQLRKTWIGSLWTNHYTIKCPFSITPKTTDITVRVEFTELLTGKTFVAQKRVQVKVKIPRIKS